MEPLDLKKYTRTYHNDTQIETALAWNAVKKTLENIGREELFAYIKSVRLTDTNLIIATGKPIVNTELSMYRENILASLRESLK